MGYFQTSYADDDPETRRRMRALAGLDPEQGEPSPTVQLDAEPASTPLEQSVARAEPAPARRDPLLALAGREESPERALTARERQADRNAIDAEGEAKWGSAINDLGVLAALVADIAGNRGRGIGKIGGGWAQGKMQAADRDRAIAQRNRERAQDSADKDQERQQNWEHADASQQRELTSREMLSREGQDATTARTQLQLDAEKLRRDAADKLSQEQLAEQRRMNDSTISDREHDNKEGERHALEAERQGRIGLGISAQAHRDAALARADALAAREEDKQRVRDDKEAQRELLHARIPGIGVHDETAYEASTTNAVAREKAREIRTTLGAAVDAANEGIEIREKIGVANPATQQRLINRFNTAKARYIGGLGRMTGAGGVLSDREFERLKDAFGDVTFNSRDAGDALLQLAGVNSGDTQLEKLKGARDDVLGQVNNNLATIGGHYERLTIPETPEEKKAAEEEAAAAPGPVKIETWTPGTYKRKGSGAGPAPFSPNLGGF